MKKMTLIEAIIERYNHYLGRKVENLANIIYFTKKKNQIKKLRDTEKVDSEERAELNKQMMNADGAIERGKENVIEDDILLKSFEELLSKQQKAN
jgi:hypothetical protein